MRVWVLTHIGVQPNKMATLGGAVIGAAVEVLKVRADRREEITTGRVHHRAIDGPHRSRRHLGPPLLGFEGLVRTHIMMSTARQTDCQVREEGLGDLLLGAHDLDQGQPALVAEVVLLGQLVQAHRRQHQGVAHERVFHGDGLLRDARQHANSKDESRIEDEGLVTRCKTSHVPLQEVRLVLLERLGAGGTLVDGVLLVGSNHQPDDRLLDAELEVVARHVVLYGGAHLLALQDRVAAVVNETWMGSGEKRVGFSAH